MQPPTCFAARAEKELNLLLLAQLPITNSFPLNDCIGSWCNREAAEAVISDLGNICSGLVMPISTDEQVGLTASISDIDTLVGFFHRIVPGPPFTGSLVIRRQPPTPSPLTLPARGPMCDPISRALYNQWASSASGTILSPTHPTIIVK